MILFLLAYLLLFPLTLANYLIVACKGKGKGYFRQTAVNMDKFGNRELRTLWNATLRKNNGYLFGDGRETISGALGKNERDGTLSTTGKVLVWILNKIEKNHCKNSIIQLTD